jgi:hypothetical protein
MSEYSLGVEKDELKKIYDKATDTKQNFLLVDLEEAPENRFRKNFNEIFEISKE